MILERITGLDSLCVGDIIVNCSSWIKDVDNYSYRVDRIDYIHRNISITNVKSKTNYGWYGIGTFTTNEYKVKKQFLEYDPNQQGDTDEDI